MSRMEKAIDNFSNVALNTEAARGRIQDVINGLVFLRL